MPYGILNFKKFKVSGLSAIAHEALRDEVEAAAHPERFPGSVDVSRTAQNTVLRGGYDVHDPGAPTAVLRDVQALMDDALGKGARVRSNTTAAVGHIVSASPEWFAGHTRGEAENYFAAALEHIEREYAGQTVYAVVHWDESNPHMHVLRVPVFVDEEGKTHFSAKDYLGGRKELSAKQTAFWEAVCKDRGLERGKCRVDNPNAPQVRHKSEVAMRNELKDEVKDLADEKFRLTGELEAANADLTFTRRYVHGAKAQVTAAEKARDEAERKARAACRRADAANREAREQMALAQAAREAREAAEGELRDLDAQADEARARLHGTLVAVGGVEGLVNDVNELKAQVNAKPTEDLVHEVLITAADTLTGAARKKAQAREDAAAQDYAQLAHGLVRVAKSNVPAVIAREIDPVTRPDDLPVRVAEIEGRIKGVDQLVKANRAMDVIGDDIPFPRPHATRRYDGPTYGL